MCTPITQNSLYSLTRSGVSGDRSFFQNHALFLKECGFFLFLPLFAPYGFQKSGAFAFLPAFQHSVKSRIFFRESNVSDYISHFSPAFSVERPTRK
jgi:hypothetical protein